MDVPKIHTKDMANDFPHPNVCDHLSEGFSERWICVIDGIFQSQSFLNFSKKSINLTHYAHQNHIRRPNPAYRAALDVATEVDVPNGRMWMTTFMNRFVLEDKLKHY